MNILARRGRVALTYLFSLMAALLAAPSQAIDLWTTWEFAQARDPIYATAQAGSAADQQLIAQARAQLLPHIYATANLDQHDRRRTRDLGQGQSSHNNLWALSLTQPIFNRQNLRLYEQAQYLAALAVIDEEQARADLMLRVSRAYFDTLGAHATLRSLQAQYQATQLQHQAAVRAFELGSATITDAQEAQSRLDLLQAQIITAENELQQKYFALERLIGERPRSLAPLSPEAILPAPEPNDPQQWQHQAGQNNLGVHRADLALQAQQAYLEANKSRHDPTLSLQARTGSQRRTNIHGPANQPRTMDSSIGIELSIPIFTGGEISAKVKEESSRVQQRHFERENKRREAIEDTQRFFSRVTSGLLEVHSLEKAEQSSQAALQANELAYEVGVRVLVDVLNAQQQLYETQRSLDQARYRVLLDSLELKHAAGILTDADLWAINQLLQEEEPVSIVSGPQKPQPMGSGSSSNFSSPSNTGNPANSAGPGYVSEAEYAPPTVWSSAGE